MRRARPRHGRRRSVTSEGTREESVVRSVPPMPAEERDVASLSEKPAQRILDTPEATLLDLVDRLLTKGVMASGDLTLGVAGIDLIYLRLSALLCAADRVLPLDRGAPEERHRSATTRPAGGARFR